MPLLLPSVYYESHAFTVRYDLERSLGMAVWRGKLTGADLQEALLICAYVMDKYRLTRWLADDRKMKAFSEEDRNWVEEHVVPAYLAGPLRRMAFLPSEDEKQVEAIEHLIQRAGDLDDLTLKSFQDEEEALRWLMQEF
ncbi:STAS/SEC14 domain-containing protein [Rufibacter sediminis]|uniref:STAS/SEC14 domain-containing protein n=1 Tax=Rufibacter sediminis TaxID=2762756 RepID=A0ABR6VU16_9BACT|nr:STAS/SEC14 domain-containing protein [Rufibacter sediminis]MBC3540702.1 STAS/SEC14 domain-containing protein [Rufibacter sediminis]